jgi:tRNA pseudouridine38-40 synthase
MKLVIAYDGTAYHGWQRQPNATTVQGRLEEVFTEVLGGAVKIHGASRTDAGVHAEGQVAEFRTATRIPDAAIAEMANGRLPGDIVIKSIETVRDGFDSSRDAVCKIYHYRIFTAPLREVIEFRRRWHYPYTLDAERMAAAARYWVGTHDFKAMASARDEREDSIRTIYWLRAERVGEDEAVVSVCADRFMYNMVRNIVGTLVEIGRGRWPVERAAEILASRDRTTAGPTAPPEGLCLMQIFYPGEPLPM